MIIAWRTSLTNDNILFHSQIARARERSLAATKDIKPYEYYLRRSASFNDPRETESLMQQLGLNGSEYYTNMSGLKGKFTSNEYAGELRNSQASKWAFR